MQESREAPPWKQITLFLLTLGVLILCALVLQPFFTAIIGAIVLAVVTQRPYDWLATKIKHRSTCAAVALVLVILAVIVPMFFLTQDLGEQVLAAVAALRSNASQNRITDFIANRPALASRLEAFTDSIDVNNAARTTAAFLAGKSAHSSATPSASSPSSSSCSSCSSSSFATAPSPSQACALSCPSAKTRPTNS